MEALLGLSVYTFLTSSHARQVDGLQSPVVPAPCLGLAHWLHSAKDRRERMDEGDSCLVQSRTRWCWGTTLPGAHISL